MAQEIGAGAPASGRRAARGGRKSRLSLAILFTGLAAVLVGVGFVVWPLVSVWGRGHTDQSALQAWNAGGSNALRWAAPSTAVNAGHVACGSSSGTDYALVSFGAPAQDHYQGVAGDGTWDLLSTRSMVHYHGTPDPGQRGNVIIAFHREPDYQDINQMNVGDTITIQDRVCHTFVYKITAAWDLPPSKVTQLVPTGGYDLTMITCDPWWQDYNRLVWRASLVSPPSSSSGGGTQSPGAAPANPSF